MRSSPRLARARSPVVPAEVYLYNPCSRSIRMDRALSSTFEAFAPDIQYSCSPPTRLRRLLVCLSLSAPTCRRSISPQTISPQRISLARYSSEGSCSTESYSDMAGGCSNRASIVVSIAWQHRDVLPTGMMLAPVCSDRLLPGRAMHCICRAIHWDNPGICCLGYSDRVVNGILDFASR